MFVRMAGTLALKVEEKSYPKFRLRGIYPLLRCPIHAYTYFIDTSTYRHAFPDVLLSRRGPTQSFASIYRIDSFLSSASHVIPGRNIPLLTSAEPGVGPA